MHNISLVYQLPLNLNYSQSLLDAIDLCLFRNCQLKQAHFNTDHFILVATVTLASLSHHRRYARSRGRFPNPLTEANAKSEEDRLHAQLARARTRTGATNGRVKSWISGDSWTLMDRRAEARRLGDRLLVRGLGRRLRRSLNQDCRDRTTRVAGEIQSSLALGHPRDAFLALKGWYRDVGPRPCLPS